MSDSGFRLITGSLPAIEQALASEVLAAKKTDPLAPVTVLLGGTLLRPYLQRRLATLTGGIVNVRFVMPSEFALALGERRQIAAGRRPLPPLADRILLREIAAGHDGYFAPVREMPGFGEALHRLVRELRGAGYDQDALAGPLAHACEAAGKSDALHALFAEFLARRKDFYAPDDCLLDADADALDTTRVLVYGLWEAPAALQAALAALATRLPVSFFLPRTDGTADEAHAALRDWLTSAGARQEDADEPESAPTGLGHLGRTLFKPSAKPGPHDGYVTLLSGPDPTREIREVARTCLGWAREGIAFHEMAVVYRHADAYRSVIESVFAETGVPLYLHEGTPLIERPVGRRTAALLDLVGGKLERRAVMDFLTDTRLPKSTRERYGGAPSARWDKLSREAGVVEGTQQWRERLALHRDSLLGGRRLEELEEWRQKEVRQLDALARFVLDFERALQDHPDRAPWSEHLAALRRLLERYVHDPSAILGALDGLERFDALGAETSFDRFRDIVRGAIETLRSADVLGTRQGAFARRGVNVLDANSLRHLRFRAVAIVGLAERSFPAPPRQDPLLLDDERTRLNERGANPIPLRARGANPEPLQFALATAAAEERLLLSYPRKSAGESRPQLPSVFFRSAAAALTGARVRAADVDLLPPKLYRRTSGSRIGAPDLATALSAAERDRTLIETDPDLGRESLVATEPRIARAFAARTAKHSRELTPWDGALSPAALEHLRQLRPADRPFSASGLESYATCPHRFFLATILRIKPVSEPETIVRIEAMDRGRLVHKVLERFLSEPPAAGEPLLHGAGELDRLQAIADEEFTRAEERGETGYALSWGYDRSEIGEDLRSWLEAEREDPSFDAMPKAGFEVRFGPDYFGEPGGALSRDEPLEIEANGVRLTVHGRIDRLNWDESQTRYRVIDYKTGKVQDDHADGDLRGGRALQLPLYLLVGSEITGIPPERGRAEYHFATRKGGFERRAFSGADLRARRQDLDALLGGIADGVRAGTFHMAPASDTSCRWCDFNGLCPANRTAEIERKREDTRALAHSKLTGIE